MEKVTLEGLGPAALWGALDEDRRRLAARAVYERRWDDPSAREELDQAIAEAIRFRVVMVRRLPADRRVEHVVRRVHPDDSLATTLLLALHLGWRRPMLSVFLDHLEIPHDAGVIDEGHDLVAPPRQALRGAVERLLREFPRDEVELYLASLLAIDPDVWGDLREQGDILL